MRRNFENSNEFKILMLGRVESGRAETVTVIQRLRTRESRWFHRARGTDGIARSSVDGSRYKGDRGERNQNKEGRAEPPNKLLFTLAMVCVPSLPPQEKSKYTCGKPPARSVKPAEKL